MVRDLIPDRIRAHGEKPVMRKLSQAAFKKALRDKLLEEVHEFINAESREEMLEELADIYEVQKALSVVENIAPKDIVRRATKKREERGGFEKRIFLEGIEK